MNNQQSSAAIRYKNYLTKAKKFFQDSSNSMIIDNHQQHNLEPNYWNHLLKDVDSMGGAALDFGCGAGRNLKNLYLRGNFSRVDGIDISGFNAVNSKKFFEENFGIGKCITTESDGVTLLPLRSNQYNFVMSHQVMQHIPNYEVRFSLLSDIYRVLMTGGVASIHYMTLDDSVGYFENYDDFPKNHTPESSNLLYEDFSKIGFLNVNVIEDINFYNGNKEWFVRAVK